MSGRRERARETRRRRLMALFAASACALAMLSVPIPLIELVVSSTGLSEIVPAAAPPLGFSARAILAGFAALAGMGLSLTLGGRPAKDELEAGQPVEHLVEGRGNMGFALARLTSFGRGRGHAAQASDAASAAADGMPVLRRADSHPDAPARRPIFASQDFGGADIFRSPASSSAAEGYEVHGVSEMADALDFAEEPAPDGAVRGVDAAPLSFSAFGDTSPPRAPEALGDREVLTEAILALPGEEPEAAALADAVSAPVDAGASLEGLSISELVDRFEQGIARRKALTQSAAAAAKLVSGIAADADGGEDAPARAEPRVLAEMPPLPRVDVRDGVDAEIEDALRAALGTLQQITSR